MSEARKRAAREYNNFCPLPREYRLKRQFRGCVDVRCDLRRELAVGFPELILGHAIPSLGEVATASARPPAQRRETERFSDNEKGLRFHERQSSGSHVGHNPYYVLRHACLRRPNLEDFFLAAEIAEGADVGDV
jgi:hypothetical protein